MNHTLTTHIAMSSQKQKSSRGRARATGDRGKTRYIRMYTEREYQKTLGSMPDIIHRAMDRSGELVEPTLDEKKNVYSTIRQFIRDRDRIVYGGTALDETIGAIQPSERFYNDYNRSDIEFYSPQPIGDLIDLLDMLYHLGFPEVSGKSARHPGSYNVIVNFELYCDITYMPTNVYKNVQTLTLDGIRYVHPHFALIDGLRIYIQPLTAADFRWEKTLKRIYSVMKHYPMPFRTPVDPKMDSTEDSRRMVNFLLGDYLQGENNHGMAITGIPAYNFYLQTAMEEPAVVKREKDSLRTLQKSIMPVYTADFTAEYFSDAVKSVYDALSALAPDAEKLEIVEYYPFFQFLENSAVIEYDGVPVCRIFSTGGQCIPIQGTAESTRSRESGYPYVAYQYLLMFLLILRFRAYINRKDEEERLYGGCAAVLMMARNVYTSSLGIPPHNETVFSEFVVNCIGRATNFNQEYFRRLKEMQKAGKHLFRYEPAKFHSKTDEEKAAFNPTRYSFPNSSGNRVNNPHKALVSFGLEMEEDMSDLDGSSYESDFDDELP